MAPDAGAHSVAHGRYVIGDEIASGGMATVHLGRMLGDAGFARTVAIKRLHAQYTRDPELCAMLLDEGRLAARIHHLNVVTTLDVVASGGDLFIVMEYVHGEPLSALIRAALRKNQQIPPRVVAAILSGALRGLHAAHEARDARGDPLGVVHRDVSPQNIMVGSDGVARVLDFGIAKAAGRSQVTQDGRIKGKFGYMPPEQLHGEALDRRSDVYAAGVVLWEALVGARLFAKVGNMPDFARLLNPVVDPPSTRVHRLSTAYDAVVARALAREAEGRFPTALDMAQALEACGPVALPAEVGAWVLEVAGDLLAELSGRVAAVENRLVAGIRDSLHLLESSDSKITHLDDVIHASTTTTNRSGLAAGAPPPAEGAPPPAAAQKVSSRPPPRPPPAGAPAAEAVSFPISDTTFPPRSSRWPEPPPARGSTMLWAGLGALGAAAIAATFAIIASVATVPGATTAAAGTTDPDPRGAASGAEPPTAAPIGASGAATAAASQGASEPSAPADPKASATASAAQASAAPSSTPRSRVTPPTPPRRAPDGCSPPFTLDALGHKHYKRQCLR